MCYEYRFDSRPRRNAARLAAITRFEIGKDRFSNGQEVSSDNGDSVAMRIRRTRRQTRQQNCDRLVGPLKVNLRPDGVTSHPPWTTWGRRFVFTNALSPSINNNNSKDYVSAIGAFRLSASRSSLGRQRFLCFGFRTIIQSAAFPESRSHYRRRRFVQMGNDGGRKRCCGRTRMLQHDS